MSDLKALLNKLTFHDDAGVQEQLVDQLLKVKTRLARVRRKILVLSGKGGVGKSAVTVQLALALARTGRRVGILDVDLNGPCVPKMLGLGNQKLTFSTEGAQPPVGPLGIRVASMAFLLDRDQATRWKGPMDLTPVWLGMMEASVIRELLSDIAWGELDVLLFDLPPAPLPINRRRSPTSSRSWRARWQSRYRPRWRWRWSRNPSCTPGIWEFASWHWSRT